MKTLLIWIQRLWRKFYLLHHKNPLNSENMRENGEKRLFNQLTNENEKKKNNITEIPLAMK